MDVSVSFILSRVFNYTLIHDAFVATIPILYACMCAVVSRQVDIINIAAEGIIMFGAFFGILISYYTGSWILAILAGIAIGIIISAFMAYAYLRYDVNIFVIGLSVNMIGASGTRFLLQTVLKTSGNFVSDKVVPIPRIRILAFSKMPVLKSLFSGYCVTEILAIPLVIILGFMLYKSVWGLRLRAVGLSETAASTAGIDVKQRKFVALVISGAFAGLAGVHLSLGYSSVFIEGMSGGRGFMGMAAMQFGNANPIWASLGCFLFGLSSSAANRLSPWGIPNQFVSMLPYVATVLVLSISVIIQKTRETKQNPSLVKNS